MQRMLLSVFGVEIRKRHTDTLLARSILHRLIPIDLYGNDANNQYFDTEPH